ncbi:MAG: DUF1178 family protein [Bradyrhizobiaceae bacterium]|nr:DUF1178 family protein [Bradyrhizobiaceae bacterium]
MIRYALICEAGHGFESWFRASEDYDRQRKRKLVECPVCGSDSVEKQIMRPSVARTDKEWARVAPAATAPAPVAVMSPQEQELRAKLKELREHVTRNADYVGDQFPDLARKMHYDEIEHRSIYGEAKPDDVKSLIDEGVEVHPLPVLPEDRN